MSVLASIIPGMTLAPPASTALAPDGTATSAPTAAIRLPLITMVPLSIVAPDTVMTRAFVIAHVGPAAFDFRSRRSAGGAGRACEAAAAGAAAGGSPF